MRKERMECQLIAKFIWIMINSKLFQICQSTLLSASSKIGCSHFKFFKIMKNLSRTLLHVIEREHDFINWFHTSILALIQDFIIDKKKNKTTSSEILYDLINP